MFKVPVPLPAFLRSGQRCERTAGARFLFLHPHQRALVEQALARCSSFESRTLLSLNLTNTISYGKADPHQCKGRASFIDCVIGGVWVCKFNPNKNVRTYTDKSQNPFFLFVFLLLQLAETIKSPNHSAGALFL